MKLISGLTAAMMVATPLAALANETTTTTDAATEPVAVEEVIAEDAVAEDIVVAEPVVVDEITNTSPWYSGIEFGVGASVTGGVDGFVGYANKKSDYWLLRRLGLRLNFATTKPIKSTIDSAIDSVVGDEGFEIEDITINNVGLEAQHMGAIIDFYPFGDTWFLGGWRISGGYYKGNFNIGANLTGAVDELPDDNLYFSFGDTEYRYLGNTVHGTAEINWDYSGPYIGTGFDLGLLWGFKIYVDAGVVFADETARANVDVPFQNLEMNIGGKWTTVEGNDTLENFVESEKLKVLKDVHDVLDDVPFYPMVKVGFMYRF